MAELSGQPSGAARRRRERRLRSMLRHEQQTVRMALAAALHHSAGPKGKVEMQQNAAPRGPKTQGGGGASYARRPTGTDGSSTGGAARHPRGAWAAEERPHRAALLRRQPADPRPALSGRVGRRGCGLLRAPLPHGPGAGGQEEG